MKPGAIVATVVALALLGAAQQAFLGREGGRKVLVRVHDREGRPLEGARIALVERERALPHGALANFPEEARAAVRPTTDAAGEAHLAVPDVPWRAWTGLPGWQHVPGEAFAAGSAPEALDFVLAPLPPEHRIAGHVGTAEGSPCRATVRFVGSGPDLGHVWTHSDRDTGAFELFVDEPGEVGALLATTYEGGEGVLQPVHGDQDDLRIALEAPQPWTIEIEDDQDRPTENVRLTLERRLMDHWVRADLPGPRQEDSAFLAVRPATPVRITVSGYGYRTLVRELEPAEIGPRLVLHVTPEAALEGVVRRNGEPVAGARVVLRDGERPRRDVEAGLEDSQRPRGRHGSKSTDAAGRFSFPIGHSGTFWIEAEDGFGGAGEVGPLKLEKGAAREVDVDLEEHALAMITGHVRTGGQPMPTLLLAGPEGRTLRWGPEPDGSFRVPDLQAGRWTVTPLAPSRDPVPRIGSLGFSSHWAAVGGPDVPMTAREVWLEPGRQAKVELELERAPDCSLVGTLALNGVPLMPRAWQADPLQPDANTAWLERLDLGRWEPCVARFRFDGSNRFVLAAHEPGDYRLRLDFAAAGQHWTILDRVTLVKGETTWRFDAPTREAELPGLEPDA